MKNTSELHENIKNIEQNDCACIYTETNYDKYQLFAFNNIKNTDMKLVQYYFSEINIKFIQNKVIDYIKSNKNITIKTSQDINHLLNNMVINYRQIRFLQIENSNEYKKVFANLNKVTIEQYIRSVLINLDMTEYYINDISNLPTPIDHPKYIAPANKGQNELGFIGYFDNNHDYTDSLNLFNSKV